MSWGTGFLTEDALPSQGYYDALDEWSADLTATNSARRDAAIFCATRLVDALRREYPDFVTLEQRSGGLYLLIGDGETFRTRVTGSLHFPPLELVCSDDVAACDPEVLIDRIIAALVRAGSVLDIARLRRDFLNSVANLAINRQIVSGGISDAVPEPAWQGHFYYPFPGLREQPAAKEFAAFCHLLPPRTALKLVVMPGMMMHDEHGSDAPRWSANWSPGQSVPDNALPLHPWTLRHSQVIRELINDGFLCTVDAELVAQPLASLRTCRLAHGGHDVKLALDTVITGERRLLYRDNVRRAPVVSAHVRSRLAPHLADVLAIQADVASFSHLADGVSPYLSLIVREPLSLIPGETIHPAIDLWSGREAARWVFDIESCDLACALMSAYARALLTGPVVAWLAFGIAFEPHVQNTYVRVRDRSPVGIVLRDIDATILMDDPCQPIVDTAALTVLGRDRLAHALDLGHLSAVANFLARRCGASYADLKHRVNEAWHEAVRNAASPMTGEGLALLEARAKVKQSLTMCLARSQEMQFLGAART